MYKTKLARPAKKAKPLTAKEIGKMSHEQFEAILLNEFANSAMRQGKELHVFDLT